MEKKINSRTIAQVKSIFKFNEKNYSDLAKVNEKIAKLEEQKAALEEAIELAEQPVLRMFGYKSGDLIEVVITPLFNEDGTPKMDAEGKYQQKKKQYVAKYGETFLPTENNDTEETAITETTAETEVSADNDDDQNAVPAIEEPTL